MWAELRRYTVSFWADQEIKHCNKSSRDVLNAWIKVSESAKLREDCRRALYLTREEIWEPKDRDESNKTWHTETSMGKGLRHPDITEACSHTNTQTQEWTHSPGNNPETAQSHDDNTNNMSVNTLKINPNKVTGPWQNVQFKRAVKIQHKIHRVLPDEKFILC